MSDSEGVTGDTNESAGGSSIKSKGVAIGACKHKEGCYSAGRANFEGDNEANGR